MKWAETRFEPTSIWRLFAGVLLGFAVATTGEWIVPNVGPVAGETLAVAVSIVVAVGLCDCCLGFRHQKCPDNESGCC